MFRKILLCSDGSPHSLRAAGAAAELTSRLGAQLSVLHVFQVPMIPAGIAGVGGLESPLYEAPSQEAQEAVVQRTVAPLKQAGISFEDLREVGFSPAEIILRTAEEGKFDLVVLGSRGAGAMSRFLLGSVSDRVLHHAHCAVLVVK